MEVPLAEACQALLLAIFTISATGKMQGCRMGSAAMCRKGAPDLLLTVVLLLGAPSLLLGLTGLLALGTGAVGFLRAWLRPEVPCNCFGMLSKPLHVLRTPTRLALLGGAIGVLMQSVAATGVTFARSDADLLAVRTVLAASLALLAYRFGHMQNGGKKKILEAPEQMLTLDRLHPGLPAGRGANGTMQTLGQLARPGAPLVLLFVSQACSACTALKDEYLAPTAPFPFPFHLVGNVPRASEHGVKVLHDDQETLRRQLGIVAQPSLLVIDSATWRPLQPLALGESPIRKALLQLLLAPEH
jgi:hypothetical protein